MGSCPLQSWGFKMDDVRYVVFKEGGEALGVFHYQEDAELFITAKYEDDIANESYNYEEIATEDVHDYI